MTTSKCFKLLSISALLIAAGASPSAQAAQDLVLQKGESVKIACEAGAALVLKGNTVQCARICKLETWTYYGSGGCDQGGCWDNTPTGYGVRLTQAGSESVLFQGSFEVSDRASLVRDLQGRFGKSCDVIQAN
ncbi:MAG: hypothetical protein ACJ763_16335 [Bdellovibrionia bacterium]